MSFLAELQKRPKSVPALGNLGLVRAFKLEDMVEPPFPTKTTKQASQTYASPFNKSTIEILRDLERKAEEEELAKQRKSELSPEDLPTTVETKTKLPLAKEKSTSKLLNLVSRRQFNATTIEDNQASNDTPTPLAKIKENKQEEEKITTKPTLAPPKSKGNPMLEELMKKRGGGGGENGGKAPEPPVKPSKPAGNPMLEELMKKRNGGGSTNVDNASPPETSKPSRSSMLEEMMRRRQEPQDSSPERNASAKEEPRAPEPTPELPETNSDVPLIEHPTYKTYFLMLKRGCPRPAVEHRMVKDGEDPAILDMDPTKPLQIVALGDDPVLGKFFKMLKAGLPRPAVEQKLRLEGVSLNLLHLDPAQPTMKKDKIDAAFEELKEKKLEKFKKMLKVGMPQGAVEQAMVKDGLDPTWLNPSAAASSSPTNFNTRKVTKPDRIRKKLHWVVINQDAMQESTLWKQQGQATLSDASIAALEKLFTKSLQEDSAHLKKEQLTTMKSSRDLLQTKVVVNLMDMKKAQNIGITLARIKVPFEQIKDEILNMNPTIMSSMHLKALIDLWPDAQEMKAIREFDGDLQSLGTAERFCYVMRDTPRFTEKLQCLVFKQEFISRSHELRETILLVLRCVHQLCTSTELRDLLLLVLNMGNILNYGKEEGQSRVKGFSLGSLVKLSQTKAFVGQTTLLQFLVEVVDRDAPHLAQFDEEISLLERASRVVTQQLYMEKKALEGGRAHLEAEAQRILAEDSETNLTAAAIRFFLTKVDMELQDLTEQLNSLNEKKSMFLRYVGEEGNYELDELFSVLWAFTEEFRAAHRKFVLKKARAHKKKPPIAECA
ncbi:unnamed protein product [Aphanomyces euteiches]|nr:hypothetical protein AeRB84_007177 [Aphanomyces euteiches]